VPPGTVASPPSVLVTTRSGAASTGVVSVPVLSPGVRSAPLVPSSAITAVLRIWSTPTATGLGTLTVIVTVLEAPTARLPIVVRYCWPETCVHGPGGFRLAAAMVVFGGSVSVIVTPVAPCVPTFW